MKKRCKPLCKGLWIGGAVALVAYVLSKEEYRQKITEEVKDASNCASDMFSFVRDNREEIIGQVRIAANEVSAIVREVGEDIKKLRETATQLRDSSEEIVKATKDAATEIKNLK